MEPKKVGRALGIGVRVASNMVRQRVAQAAATPSPAAAAPVTVGVPPAAATARPPATHLSPAPSTTRAETQSQPRPKPQPARKANRIHTAKRGAQAFTQALLGPFTHAGSILWLEITGLFFGLFTLFFLQSIYRVHAAWKQGPEHAHLLLYCFLAVVFAWFSGSSFLRAVRKSRAGVQGSRTRS